VLSQAGKKLRRSWKEKKRRIGAVPPSLLRGKRKKKRGARWRLSLTLPFWRGGNAREKRGEEKKGVNHLN